MKKRMITRFEEGMEDHPVADLARRLQAKIAAPAHLEPELLADAVCEAFGLSVPVTLPDAMAVLEQLEIRINPPELARFRAIVEGDKVWNGHNAWDYGNKSWDVLINTRRSRPRQIQSVFHELYEILRNYFHLWGGQFPEGWDGSHYRPEQYARWFAGAVALPREYVLNFVFHNGHDPEMLRSEAGTSRNMTARRLRECIPEVPIVLVECALPKYLFNQAVPAMRCIESVRSPEFSVRLNKRNGRKYHIPRKKEVWTAGSFVETVAGSGRLVFVELVTGWDLFRGRDMCALGVPIYRKARLVSVAIYATPAPCRDVWSGVIERMEPLVLAELYGLTGAPQRRAPRKRKPGVEEKRKPLLSLKTKLGEPIKKYRNPRAPKPERAPKQQGTLEIDTAIPTTIEAGQLKWGMDEPGVGDELYVPSTGSASEDE